MNDKATTVIRETMAAFVDAAPTSPDLPTSMAPEPRRTPVLIAGVAFAAATVVVLVVIGGGALLTRNSDEAIVDEPVTTVAQPTTAAASTTQAVPTTPAPPTTIATPPTTTATAPPLLGWVRVDDQGGLAGGAMNSVVAGGPGLVAVGQAAEVTEEPSPDGDTSEDAAVWVSMDGTTWERINDPSFTGESETNCSEYFVGSQEMTYVAAGPLGVVAVGRDACSSAVWFSEDARTWTEVIADDWRSNPLAVQAVAAGGPGWVAVGGDGQGNGMVWVSSDGLDWTAVSDEDLLATDLSHRVDLFDVSAGGPGLIAVGIIGIQETGTERSAVFVSVDGLDWERIGEDAIGGAGLFRIGHDPATGTLMTFSRPDADVPHEVAWTSTDGLHWTPSESAGPPANNSVASNGERLVAAGPGWKSTNLSVWTSADGGSTWTEIGRDAPALDPGHEAGDIVAFNGRVVIVGADPGATPETAVWIGEWTND